MKKARVGFVNAIDDDESSLVVGAASSTVVGETEDEDVIETKTIVVKNKAECPFLSWDEDIDWACIVDGGEVLPCDFAGSCPLREKPVLVMLKED